MKEFLGAAIHIARQAGTVLLPFFERRVAVEYKGDVDLVTEADLPLPAAYVNGRFHIYALDEPSPARPSDARR